MNAKRRIILKGYQNNFTLLKNLKKSFCQVRRSYNTDYFFRR